MGKTRMAGQSHLANRSHLPYGKVVGMTGLSLLRQALRGGAVAPDCNAASAAEQ